jgi:ApaG protein
MSGAAASAELPGLRVTVDRVVFLPHAQTPADRPFCFAYCITIHNDAAVPVTVRGRKWVVRADDGEVTAVEGDGVVGQTPRLEPGENWSYQSFHLLRTRTAVAAGAYLAVDDAGRRVVTRIPAFQMTVPGGD